MNRALLSIWAGFALIATIAAFAQGPAGSQIPRRQILPCPLPTGAQGGVFLSLPATAVPVCAVLGPGLTITTSTAGVVTISAPAIQAPATTITRTLVTATTANSYPIPAGQTLRRVTDVIPMYAERGDYSIVGGAVVLTVPAAPGEVVELESQ